MMTSRYHNVVIVGGSISGLMSALTISSTGCKVTILERIQEHSFKDQGAGLAIRPDVGEFLDNYKSKSVAIELFAGHDTTILEQDGTIAGEVPLPPNIYSTSWTNLATALRKSLLNDVQFGSEVSGIVRVGDKLSVEYQRHGKTHHIADVDLVVGADGANSTVRKLMGLSIPRIYAGYCFYRGVVSVTDLTPDTAKALESNNNFWSVHDRSNILTYRIGHNKIMWGIYRLHNEEELKDALLDVDGHQHYVSLIQGMRPEILDGIKQWSKTHFPRQLSECVEISETATLQAITDCESPENSFMEDQVLLVGEASVLPRPHVVAGTGLAAYHALRLKDLVEGVINAEEWSRNTKAFSNVLRDSSHEQGVIWMEKDGNFEVVKESRMALAKTIARLDAVRQDLRISSQKKT